MTYTDRAWWFLSSGRLFPRMFPSCCCLWSCLDSLLSSSRGGCLRICSTWWRQLHGGETVERYTSREQQRKRWTAQNTVQINQTEMHINCVVIATTITLVFVKRFIINQKRRSITLGCVFVTITSDINLSEVDILKCQTQLVLNCSLIRTVLSSARCKCHRGTSSSSWRQERRQEDVNLPELMASAKTRATSRLSIAATFEFPADNRVCGVTGSPRT